MLLVDTNVVSFVMKRHQLGEQYAALMTKQELAISFMTLGELYQGGFRAKWGHKQFDRLARVLETYAVLPSSLECCWRWADIRFERRSHPISVEDAWIAATSLTYKCPLVTHNPKDFRNIRGLRIITAES